MSFKTFMALALSLFLVSAHADFKDLFDKPKIKGKIRERIASLDTEFKLKLLDIELAEGIGLSTRYKYEVTNGYYGNLHTRVDRYNIGFDINVGDIIRDIVDLPVGLALKKGAEVYFVRHFTNKKAASIAKPYLIRQLPLNSKIAKRHLNPGDFVSFPVEMAFTTSFGHDSNLTPVNSKAGVFYVLKGSFIIQVYRLPKGFVRLKIISARTKEGGMNGRIGINKSLDIFKVSAFSHNIDRITNIDLLDITGSQAQGQQFMADYIFDLKTIPGSIAYDQVLKRALSFKTIQLAAQQDRTLDQVLLSTYQMADEIANADAKIDNGTKRVERVMIGFNRFKHNRGKVKMKTYFSHFEANRNYLENSLSFIQGQDDKKYYFWPIASKETIKKLGKWILQYKEDKRRVFSGLVETDAEGRALSDWEMIYSFDYQDNYLRQHEQRRFFEDLANNVPAIAIAPIKWSSWKKWDKEMVSSAKLHLKMELKQEAVQYIRTLSQSEIKKRMLDYFNKRTFKYAGRLNKLWIKTFRAISLQKLRYKTEVKLIAKKLYRTLHQKNQDYKEQLQGFLKLRHATIFDNMIIGLLISLLPKDQYKQMIAVQVYAAGDNRPTINHFFGEFDNQELHENLETIYDTINNRAFNPRIVKPYIMEAKE